MEAWANVDKKDMVLSFKEAHRLATTYMYKNFLTSQTPVIGLSKRIKYFPFAVKGISLS